MWVKFFKRMCTLIQHESVKQTKNNSLQDIWKNNPKKTHVQYENFCDMNPKVTKNIGIEHHLWKRAS